LFAETRETLGIRAGCAAQCILALNQQLDLLLSALPAAEGDEENLETILEALNKENVSAGGDVCIQLSGMMCAETFTCCWDHGESDERFWTENISPSCCTSISQTTISPLDPQRHGGARG
jgi:hypothetical protein